MQAFRSAFLIHSPQANTFIIHYPLFIFHYSLVNRLTLHSQPLDRVAFPQPPLIDFGAFFVPGKGLFRCLLIPVHLPGADAFAALPAVPDKPGDVDRRIAQKQADLVRETTAALQLPFQAAQTFPCVPFRVPFPAEQLPGLDRKSAV